jgi:hypothetical protein
MPVFKRRNETPLERELAVARARREHLKGQRIDAQHALDRGTHSPLMFADLMMGPTTRPAPSGTWWCDRNAVALIACVATADFFNTIGPKRRKSISAPMSAVEGKADSLCSL